MAANGKRSTREVEGSTGNDGRLRALRSAPILSRRCSNERLAISDRSGQGGQDDIHYKSTLAPVTKYRRTLRRRDETKPQRCGDSAKPRDHRGALRWCFPSAASATCRPRYRLVPVPRPQRARALISPYAGPAAEFASAWRISFRCRACRHGALCDTRRHYSEPINVLGSVSPPDSNFPAMSGTSLALLVIGTAVTGGLSFPPDASARPSTRPPRASGVLFCTLRAGGRCRMAQMSSVWALSGGARWPCPRCKRRCEPDARCARTLRSDVVDTGQGYPAPKPTATLRPAMVGWAGGIRSAATAISRRRSTSCYSLGWSSG